MRTNHPGHAHHVKVHGHPHEGPSEAEIPAALSDVVVRHPAVLHGMPVFTETVVPVEALLEYRRAGAPLYEFLLDFPSVRRAHAKRVWAWMEKLSVADVRKALAHVKAQPGGLPPHVHKRHGE